MSDRDLALRPPASPWKPVRDSGEGYLSVFLSDALARWPVRDVTRPGDNKSDPNLETQSYGLFSTCEPSMRRIIARTGSSNVFFMTSRKGLGRVLVGYYHIAWQAPGSRGAENGDYALAADRIKFFEPIKPAGIRKPLRDVLESRFRTQKPISRDIASDLLTLIAGTEDRTADYVEEIRRLEQFARFRTGLAYPSWGRISGFGWEDAAEYLQVQDSPEDAPNSSPTGLWRCTECHYVIKNRALLKKCPVCGHQATLRPA